MTLRTNHLASLGAIAVVLSTAAFAIQPSDNLPKESLQARPLLNRSDEAATVPKRRIVLIPTALDHPWATHMYRSGCELLAACLNRHPDVEAVVSPDDGWPRDPAILEGVDAIAFYSCPAGDLLLAPENRDAAQKLMKDGVGLVAVHWATGTTKDQFGPAYLDLLGGWFSFAHSGLKVDKQPLTQVDQKHPICRGWEPYDLRDEFYLNLKFHPAAKPILQANIDGVNQTVAWAFERPAGGRSFGTTLGHFHDNFAIDAFRQAIVNGVLWSAGVEVPENGADVDLPDAELQLPQAPAAGGAPAALKQPQPRPAAERPAQLNAQLQEKKPATSAGVRGDRAASTKADANAALRYSPARYPSVALLPSPAAFVVQLVDDIKGGVDNDVRCDRLVREARSSSLVSFGKDGRATPSDGLGRLLANSAVAVFQGTPPSPSDESPAVGYDRPSSYSPASASRLTATVRTDGRIAYRPIPFWALLSRIHAATVTRNVSDGVANTYVCIDTAAASRPERPADAPTSASGAKRS